MSAPTSQQAVIVAMPRLSDSMEEGTIVNWLVEDGQVVERGQEIVEIETDKATMVYEAPASGPLWILAGSEETVVVGDPIASIGAERGATAEQPATPAPEAAVAEPEEAAPAGPADGVRVSPVARRLAAERGVDLAALVGSGPGGRILKQDVLDAPAAPSAAADGAAGGARGSSRREEPTRTQAIVARRMSEARATVPDFPTCIEIRISAALALREQLAGVLDPVPTMNDFLVAAVARTLTAHPRLNASFADGGFVYFDEVNVGIAVAVGDELLVPVIAGAESLPLASIAAESRRLVERTRSGAVTPPDLAGGTFTISNLGMFGISSFQPIINSPQAAILGVGGISPASDGRPAAMTLTLVSDHRIVYGAHAAKFLADLRDLLESPLALVAA